MFRHSLLLASLLLVASTTTAHASVDAKIADSAAAEINSTTDRVSTRKQFRRVTRPTEAPLVQAASTDKPAVVGKLLSQRIGRRGAKGL